ncbi:MAG: hypothetical protein AAFZ65_10355 [Planctomycetota bacterium]
MLSLSAVRVLGLGALVSLAGCGGEYGQIDAVRTGREPLVEPVVGQPGIERYFERRQEPRRVENPLTWDVPAGWREVEPRSEFRIVDMQLGDDPRAECYLSILPGSGGGLLANVNRWYAQFGAEPLTESLVAQLPRHTLLRNPAVLVRLEGPFQGMVGEPIDEARLLGLVLEAPEFTFFVKATGPAEVLAAAEADFFRFVDSIRFAERVGGPAGVGGSAGGDAPGTVPPFEGESRAPAPPSARRLISGRDLPAGWELGGERAMRLMTVVTPAGEISVSRAGGSLQQNVTRWYGQLGATPPAPEDLAGLPTVPMLGAQATLVEVEGDFSGMGADDVEGALLIGLVCPLDDGDSLFVKLVGPAERVRAERLRFLSFAQSLAWE